LANPAVTLARAVTNTFAGIRPVDVVPFIIAQTRGATAASALFRSLIPSLPAIAEDGVLPHDNRNRSVRT